MKATPDHMETRRFELRDSNAVVALWRRCSLLMPWNDPYRDIERKLSEQPELFLVGELGEEVVATVMAGFDGHRGWVYYLAVAPEHRGKSFGRTLMNEVERLLLERGCPKVNLMVRTSNDSVLEFYRTLGYEQDEVINLGKRLIED